MKGRPLGRGRREALRARPNAVVAVLAFAGIVISLMQTLVIPIVPELPRLLDAPASDTAWAVTATLLAAAGVIGVIRDQLRRKVRLASGKTPRAASAIVDSQSIKVSETVGKDTRGWDEAKKINGRKGA
ncbi:hypothetical protein GCM10023080_066780 [Streptomyces pseudoechinosporeus]